MLKYLRSTPGSVTTTTGPIDLDSISSLIQNLTVLTQPVTFTSLEKSIDPITGAVVIYGGLGVGGNVNVDGNITVDNITTINGTYTGSVSVAGSVTAASGRFLGTLSATSANLGVVTASSISVNNLGSFGNVQVNYTANIGTLAAINGGFQNLTAESFAAVSTSAVNSYVNDLYVDVLHPRHGTQINLGDSTEVRITGGQPGQTLITDGQGTLTWQYPSNLTNFNNGLVKAGNDVSLEETGVAAGSYDRVTVDAYGRVTSGTSTLETLDRVVSRGSVTSRRITISNTTESTDVNQGALTVAGGLGVGKTLTADLAVIKSALTTEGTYQAIGDVETYKSLTLLGGLNGYAPLRIAPASLIGISQSGDIEYDGNFLYITTDSGRQILQTRNASSPTVPVTLVKAVATQQIDIAAATQQISIAGEPTDAWDDVILQMYDWVLLINQIDPIENGVYVWHGEGGALTRAADFSASSGVKSGFTIMVSGGTRNAGSFYTVTSPDPINVGSSNIVIEQHFSKDNVALGKLSKDSTSGLVVRTEYGAVALRQVHSSSAWLTVTNPDGKTGNITINTGTVPVSSGGTGRTTLTGWVKGIGASVLTLPNIPLAEISGAGTMAAQNANNVSIIGGNINVSNVTTTSARVTGNITVGNAEITGTTKANTITANSIVVESITVTGGAGSGLVANIISLGANSIGSLNTAAVTVDPTQNVTDTIALMNVVLGKLVPPPPPAFPASQSISIGGMTTGRMSSFTQTDNTATGGKAVTAGSIVSTTRRSSSYVTSTIAGAGPGDTGTVGVYLNGSVAGSKTMVAGGNGTFGDLIITNNQDYSLINNAVNSNFWYSFDAHAAGTVTEGWNEVYIDHSAASSTNTLTWYYDSSSPGTPTFTNSMITMDVNVSIYSSTIPHYTHTSRFDVTFDVNKLSGDTYPVSDTFAIGTAGGAFEAPVSLTYNTAGIATPLARNLYVNSGSASISTRANIITGFGSSSVGPSIAVNNGYYTGTHVFDPGVTVLYKTGVNIQVEETNIPVNSVGTGSGNAVRIINPGSGDTPTFTASALAFDSQTSELNTDDATVVAAVLKHDQTNYSSNYLPIGPDLSVGRTGPQYFTFKFTRNTVSKFDVKYTGILAGLWVALPGSSIDSTSTINGWLSLSSAYNGAGIPGAGAGGNGSNGCSVGGVAILNSAQSNRRVTATFGTLSSSTTATHEIYVRIKLTAGQSITALSIEAASN